MNDPSEASFDVVVIGGGPAGENVAGRVAAAGLSVALIEKELVGGECSYWGCIPSKTLVRPGDLVAAVSRAPGVDTVPVDVAAVLAWRDEMTSNWTDDGQVEWLRGAGVTLLRGEGRLSGARRVVVEPRGESSQRELTARRAVVIATGTTAAVPPIDGLADARPWDNRGVTAAKKVPPRLLVLGGGAVGAEMAQAFARLGSRVTVLEGGERLLAHEEPFAGEEVRAAFEAEGIDVRVGARVVGVTRRGDGP
ncbi:MAG: pyridine nucleotide-disulfide oxidoreductase, partial [Candidatus Aeolococcus gillhamiae]